jgi:hypothetical protein
MWLIKVQQLIQETQVQVMIYILQSAVKTYVDANSSISAITSKTTDYNVLSSDYTILCNSSAGTLHLSLPDASSLCGKSMSFV